MIRVEIDVSPASASAALVACGEGTLSHPLPVARQGEGCSLACLPTGGRDETNIRATLSEIKPETIAERGVVARQGR